MYARKTGIVRCDMRLLLALVFVVFGGVAAQAQEGAVDPIGCGTDVAGCAEVVRAYAKGTPQFRKDPARADLMKREAAALSYASIFPEQAFDRACDAGLGDGCVRYAKLKYSRDYVSSPNATVLESITSRLGRGCDLGAIYACHMLAALTEG